VTDTLATIYHRRDRQHSSVKVSKSGELRGVLKTVSRSF